MARPSARDASTVREIEHLLAQVDLSKAGGVRLQDAIHVLHDSCEVKGTVLYSLLPEGTGLRMDTIAVGGLDSIAIRREMDRYLANKVVGWSSFNPLMPEPDQRNKVMDWAPVPVDRARTPIEREIYPKLGVGGCGTLRVLLCEGAQLVGYLALFGEEVSTARQRQLLRRLVPAFRNRMGVECLLSCFKAPSTAVFDVLLEELGGVACLVDVRARVLAANSRARQELSRDVRTFSEDLAESLRAVRSNPLRNDSPFRLVAIVPERGTPYQYLAIRRPSVEETSARLERNAATYGLTTREFAIARLVVQGQTNRAIAVRLRIAERTVEAHLTSILSKTHTPSRAAAVAKLLQ